MGESVQELVDTVLFCRDLAEFGFFDEDDEEESELDEGREDLGDAEGEAKGDASGETRNQGGKRPREGRDRAY